MKGSGDANELLPFWAGISGQIMEHRWGAETAALNPPFDVIVACGMPKTGKPNFPAENMRSGVTKIGLAACGMRKAGAVATVDWYLDVQRC